MSAHTGEGKGQPDGRYSLQFTAIADPAPQPATQRKRQITDPDLPPARRSYRAPTAPERTISGNQPIHPEIVKGMVGQQSAADGLHKALEGLEERVARLGSA